MFITDAQISFTILDCLKKDHKDCKRADHLEHPVSTRNFTQTYEITVGHGYYICTLRILDRSWRRFIMLDQCWMALLSQTDGQGCKTPYLLPHRHTQLPKCAFSYFLIGSSRTHGRMDRQIE